MSICRFHIVSLSACSSCFSLPVAITSARCWPFFLQAQDRAHRIGQKKVVKVFRLVAAGTVEERILHQVLAVSRIPQMQITD